MMFVKLVVEPAAASIPPPALLEIFCVIAVPSALNVPAKLNTPPPEAPPVVAVLELIELPITETVPALM